MGEMQGVREYETSVALTFEKSVILLFLFCESCDDQMSIGLRIFETDFESRVAHLPLPFERNRQLTCNFLTVSRDTKVIALQAALQTHDPLYTGMCHPGISMIPLLS